MTPEDISSLPISMLKSILSRNHVNATLLIEKSDLVEKVRTLVDEERTQRQREAMYREREQEEERERQLEILEEIQRARRPREQNDTEPAATPIPPEVVIDPEHTALTTDTSGSIGENGRTDEAKPMLHAASNPQRSPAIMASTLERTGLCVICQDEEANIAIVDCGHMVMCRNCSDLVMSSTRECPLCRTRIVTEARLLRIFKA